MTSLACKRPVEQERGLKFNGPLLWPKKENKNMTEQELSALTITSFEDFENGQSGSNFLLEEGSYDGAIVVGYNLQKATFENKERVLVTLLWQVQDAEGEVYTIRGNGWTISANDKSKMRTELSKWFNTQEWGKVCEILVKGGILVRHEDGSAHFELANFIGKRGKLLITEKTSKKGAKFNVIASISPTKKKGPFEYGEVPWFLVEGEDIIAAKLADGVQIRRKEESDTAAVEPVPQQTQPGTFVSAKQAIPPKPQGVTQSAFPAAATPVAPNPTPAAPVVNDEDDLPF